MNICIKDFRVCVVPHDLTSKNFREQYHLLPLRLSTQYDELYEAQDYVAYLVQVPGTYDIQYIVLGVLPGIQYSVCTMDIYASIM